jgi:tRNA modification GTPase
MPEYKNDTIAAISTPRGRGGIAIIRVSGPDSFKLAEKYLKIKKPIDSLKSRTAYRSAFYNNAELVDDVMFTLFRAPKSYTGEDILEISCHGNDFIAVQILEALLQDARLANPGEFTLRAFLNNKMDLTRAEAIGNLLMAQTQKAQKASLMQIEGKLEAKIGSLLKKITDYRIQFELAIDFIEDEVPVINEEKLKKSISDLIDELEILVENGHDGMIIQDGLKICLAGEPNVGKSSLFNRFLQTERAIVTPIPGTTRDYIEEAISLDGNLIRIFDTAGIREANDHVEKIGIEKSYSLMQDADFVVLIMEKDSETDFETEIEKDINAQQLIKVINKSDLLSENEKRDLSEKGYILCSTMQDNGLDELKAVLLKRFANIDQEIESGIISNARQLAAAKKALNSVKNAYSALNNNMGVEFVAFDLKEASLSLEEIIGKISTDELLDQIFENFCIGK